MTYLLLLSCLNTTSAPFVVTQGEGFFSSPWPSDLRTIDGRPDMTLWEHQGENPLIDAFVAETQTLYGFGTNSPIYFQLTAPPDLTALPNEIDSLNQNSSIHIIDVDPNSPHRGERFPVRWDFQEEQTHWQPSNLLAVAPTWGFALRPDTTYAAVVTTDLISPTNEFSSVWESEHPLHDHYESLFRTWLELGHSINKIAHATVFTTQNPLYDLIQISKRIEEEISTPALDQELVWQKEGNGCQYFDGQMLVPIWTFGDKPYATSGGYFGYDDQGRPLVASWELVTFRMSVPDTPMPQEGWPVVIYSHGTGGAYHSFANNSGEMEPATQFTKAEMVGIGISQPLHADRGTGANPELYSFNYLNPPSARTMFRQGAADQIYLSKVLSKQHHQLTTDTDEVVLLNPSQVHYVGHSHGGEVGALALPFMNKYLKSAVLSGAGGALSITLMERDSGTDGVDLETLIENALTLAPNEVISPFHPAIGLVQMLAEVTDPLNYARYWFQDPVYWESNPISVLMTEGMNDEYTPPKSIEILSAAANIPIVGEVHSLNTAYQILGHLNSDSAHQNRSAHNDLLITAGLLQYPEDGHFPIFQNADAVDAYRTFLETAVSDSSPSIVP